MNIVFMHKFRFFGLFALGITLVMQAALVSTVHDRFYAMMPHILPGHDMTLFVTVMSFVLGTLAVTINLLDGVGNPRETGVGKRVGVWTGVVALATIFTIAVAMIWEWGLPVVFLIAAGGLVTVGLVILFDNTEQRRIELAAHTAEAARLGRRSDLAI